MRLTRFLRVVCLAHYADAFVRPGLQKTPAIVWKHHKSLQRNLVPTIHPKLTRQTVCANAGAEPMEAVEALFKTRANWNFILIGSALIFGSIFEGTVESLKERLPERLLPVVEQSLIQFATLGFVGLVIESISLSNGAEVLEGLSNDFLGNKGFLLERFEELHEGLFEVTILYFAACTLLILQISRQFKEWDYERRFTYLDFRIREYEWKQKRRAELVAGIPQNNDTFIQRGWSQAAKKMEIDERSSGIGALYDELLASYDVRVAEFLRFRERFIQQSRADGVFLPRSFSFSEYLQEHSSKNLKKLVSIEAITLCYMWAPWASLSWAFELFGLEVSTVNFDNFALEEAIELNNIEVVFILSQFFLIVWAGGNFFKMKQIKSLLRPQLAKKCIDTDNFQRRLLPPAYKLAGGRGGSWGALEPISRFLEMPYSMAARNRHEALFGVVGRNGPDYYLQSQKLVLFNAIASIGFSHIFFEETNLGTWITNVALVPAVLVIIVSPATFLMYNWATSVEDIKDKESLNMVLRQQRETQFRANLQTLSKLCTCFETVAAGGKLNSHDAGSSKPFELMLDSENQEELLNVIIVFDLADMNSDGVVTREELALISRNLGYELSEEAVENFFVQTTKRSNLSDGILFSDFMNVVVLSSTENSVSKTTLAKRSERLFRFFDQDMNGEIRIDEMTFRLMKMGFDTAGTEQLFVDITGTPQSTISRREFMAYIDRTEMLVESG